MPDATDWDRYYDHPYKPATVTRRITGAALLDALRTYGGREGATIAELGGANSCFYDRIVAEIHPRAYHVIDNNRRGLERFRERVRDERLHLHLRDILDPIPGLTVDIALSVGLIEHFDRAGTRRAVEAHFDVLRPGGVCVMTFPTPTLLYRAIRAASERLNMWIFHDERPLRLQEVTEAAEPLGTLLHRRLIWQIGLTQYLVVFRKRGPV